MTTGTPTPPTPPTTPTVPAPGPLPPAPPAVIDGRGRLWAIIYGSMRAPGVPPPFLDPNIPRMGYVGFFQRAIDVMQYPVYGIVVHTPWGLLPNGSQSFHMQSTLKAYQPSLTSEGLANGLRVLRSMCVRLAVYVGPAGTWFDQLGDVAKTQEVRDQIGSVIEVADYIIEDGSGSAASGSPKRLLLDALDSERGASVNGFGQMLDQGPFAGIETMARSGVPQLGSRVSFTLAGETVDGHQTGYFDPETDSTPDRLHPAFARRSEITGEKIVLDLAHMDQATAEGRDKLDRRTALLLSLGCSPCFPHWQIPRLRWRYGAFQNAPSTPVSDAKAAAQ